MGRKILNYAAYPNDNLITNTSDTFYARSNYVGLGKQIPNIIDRIHPVKSEFISDRFYQSLSFLDLDFGSSPRLQPLKAFC